MTKEEFLKLAGETFDQINPVVNEEKIALDKDVFDEIQDQISSEIYDSGMDIVDDYELEMYSREITLESISLNVGDIDKIVKNVLERYFEKK